MKIMHLLSSSKFSGAENVVCQIINMFRDESGVEMVYCSPDGDISSALAERKVIFEPVHKMTLKEIRRVIKLVKPDVIHAHDMRASFLAARSCGNIPFVSHIHGNFAGLNNVTPKAVAYAFAAIKAKHIFWVSKSSFDNYVFKKLCKGKSSILYNVIDIDSLYQKMQLDTKEYNYDIIFLGRLTWEKDPNRLLRVIKLVAEKKNEVKIAIVGTGDLEEQTKKLCTELDLDRNVDFLGFCSNPLKILHDSKVMLMTSIREGTPMCALEAMALGVPIVSTPTDGMKDLVVNGETGFLSDEDDELVDCVCKILISADVYNDLAQKAIQRLNMMNNTKVYYSKLMDAYAK